MAFLGRSLVLAPSTHLMHSVKTTSHLKTSQSSNSEDQIQSSNHFQNMNPHIEANIDFPGIQRNS